MPHRSLRGATVVLLLVILKEQPSSSAPLNGKVSACFTKKKSPVHTASPGQRISARRLQDKVKLLLSERGSCCVPPSTLERMLALRSFRMHRLLSLGGGTLPF